MRFFSSNAFLILLLFKFRAGTQVADIYDILTKDGNQQKREGSQYVVGLYKELPKHAVTKGAHIVSMKNKYGSEFTCMIPNSRDDSEEEEEETEIEEVEKAYERIETDASPEEAATPEEAAIPEEAEEEQQIVEEPVMLDKLTWLLRNYEGSCLQHDGGYWKTKVCFQPIPHIIQQHNQVKFNLGSLDGVFDSEKFDHRKLKHVAALGDKKHPPFLQLAFLDGSDGRKSLVNIRCARIYDRVKKMSEPIELVYLFDLSIKSVCGYDAYLMKEAPELQLSDPEVLTTAEGSVEQILEETFSLLPPKGSVKESCLYYQPGWFTFEICYQKQIQQYHVQHQRNKGKASTQIVTQHFSLGNWDGQPLVMVEGSTPDKSYAKAVYIDGTQCDLTGKPRMSTVHYKCNKDIKDTRVELFQEVETCVYLFVIGTKSLCEHSEFKSEPLNTKEIICYLTNSPPNIAKGKKLETSDDISSEDTSIP